MPGAFKGTEGGRVFESPLTKPVPCQIVENRTNLLSDGRHTINTHSDISWQCQPDIQNAEYGNGAPKIILKCLR